MEHYCCCSAFWDYVAARGPTGLGVPRALRSKEATLLIRDGMADEVKVRMALAVYALHRVVSLVRAGDVREVRINHTTLLRLWVRRAAEGSRASALLHV